MTRLVPIAAVLFALAALAPAAFAAQAPGGSANPNASPDTSVTPPPAQPDDPDGATQVIVGRVLDVDPAEGRLTLQTSFGVVALFGPGDQLKGLSPGDVVAVHVPAATPPPVPSTTPPASDDRIAL